MVQNSQVLLDGCGDTRNLIPITAHSVVILRLFVMSQCQGTSVRLHRLICLQCGSPKLYLLREEEIVGQ